MQVLEVILMYLLKTAGDGAILMSKYEMTIQWGVK
jgi:hypothetical protein